MFTDLRTDEQLRADAPRQGRIDNPACRGIDHPISMTAEILLFQRPIVTESMQQKRIYQIFQISVVLKGLHGLVEIAGGLALALFSTDAILRLIYRFDSHHWVARHFSTGEHSYYIFFFLTHGALNLALAIGLLMEKLWAYPAAIAILTLFIVMQMFRFTHVHDPGLVFFSILDVIVIILAIHEYRLLRKHLPTH
jgi:uncharacterized membrane protein